jgi:hypothetical protein
MFQAVEGVKNCEISIQLALTRFCSAVVGLEVAETSGIVRESRLFSGPTFAMKTFLSSSLSVFLFWNSSFAGETNLPTTLAELDRWYKEPPADQNAATRFLEGMAALKITDADTESANLPLIGKGELPKADKPVPLTMNAAIAEFIQRNQPAFSLFNQGVGFQQSRYPIDLNRGQAVLLPHLPKFKNAAQILEFSALSHAATGQGKEAGDDVLMNLALARSLESEPVLISQLVRVACDMIAVKALEQTINRVVLPPRTLDQLQESFRQSEEQEAAGFGFTRALVGERTTDLSLFGMLPEQYLVVSEKATPRERAQLTPEIIKEILAADRQHCATTFDQVFAERNKPFPQRLSQDEIFSGAATVATNKHFILSSMLLPGLPRAASREAGGLAYLRLAQTAVALERFRSTHTNNYCESLNELMPKFLRTVPKDPFDGKSLRYYKVGNGYALYSVGRNLKNDGSKRPTDREANFIFNVINPPKPTP